MVTRPETLAGLEAGWETMRFETERWKAAWTPRERFEPSLPEPGRWRCEQWAARCRELKFLQRRRNQRRLFWACAHRNSVGRDFYLRNCYLKPVHWLRQLNSDRRARRLQAAQLCYLPAEHQKSARRENCSIGEAAAWRRQERERQVLQPSRVSRAGMKTRSAA